MGPLLLVVMLAQVTAPLDHPPPSEIPVDPMEAFTEIRPRTISFTGRFAPDGKVATMQIEISSGCRLPLPSHGS